MNNDFRIPLFISLGLHLGVFIVTSVHPSRAIYINIPVELMFNTIPAQSEPSAPPAASVQEPKKEDEVAMPAKAKPKQKKPKPLKTKTLPSPAAHAPVPARPPANVSAPATGGPLTASGQLTLESARFPFAYYANSIRTKIDRNWQRSTEFERLKTVVYFQILRNGEIGRLDIKESSGDALFDQLAIRAIKLSAPFAPLPEAYNDDHLGVYFDFTFK